MTVCISSVAFVIGVIVSCGGKHKLKKKLFMSMIMGTVVKV